MLVSLQQGDAQGLEGPDGALSTGSPKSISGRGPVRTQTFAPRLLREHLLSPLVDVVDAPVDVRDKNSVKQDLGLIR